MIGGLSVFTKRGCTAVGLLAKQMPGLTLAGIAIRIMQSLHSLHIAPYPLEPSLHSDCDNLDGITFAIENRTYWACFIMDCMTNAGTYNPSMLPLSEMERLKVLRPSNAVQFALSLGLPDTTGSAFCKTPAALDIIDGAEMLVSGFDIWTQIMSFVFYDGRKAPGMCSPSNCPWVPESPWSDIRNKLKNWRGKQHTHLRYPGSPVAVHTMLGYGETYIYLNLLYYVRHVPHVDLQ